MKNLLIFILLTLNLYSNNVNAEKITYFHTDVLGSPVAATDEGGNVIWTEHYKPFGERVNNTSEGSDNNIGFTGHELDSDTGLTYMQARYYDPVIGRFYSNDPVDALGHMQRGNSIAHGFNRYAYANNNPYKYTDPDGEFINFAVKFVADVALGAALNYAETGSVNLGGAVADAAAGALNPAKTVQKAKRLAKVIKGGSCCFVAGTQVLTEDGYKNIEDVKLGEKLWAKNTDTGEQEWKPVTKIFVEPDRGIFEIKLLGEKGFEQKIEATDDHPFYVVGKGWKQTIELEVGDLIETDGHGSMKVISVTDEERLDLTYNFTVADFHTYYVTKKNVLVHNCNKKASTANLGDKVQTPDTHGDKFTKLGGGQGMKNKKTGEIWQESKTNHSGDSVGEYKVGVNGKPPTKSKKITVTRSDSKVCKKDGC